MKNLSIVLITLLNFLLFLGKFFIGISSHSAALISEAINSLSDTINSIAVLWATNLSQQEADDCHQGGHGRAQPLAAFFIAIMTGILALEVIKEGVIRFMNPEEITNIFYVFGILSLTILVKGSLSVFEYYKGKKENNASLIAMSVESRGDVLIAIGAIFGISLSYYYHITWADPLTAIVIGFYILYTGYIIAKENIDYLMGASASPDQVKKIQNIIFSFDEVVDAHDLRTQHLGETIQVTVHCAIEGKNHTLQEWHDIETKISDRIEELSFVERAFVHLDLL